MNVNPGKTEFTEAELTGLRADMRSKMAELGIAQAELGRQAEIPAATLSQFLSGTYNSEPGRTHVAQKLERGLRSLEVAAEVRRRLPIRPAFIPMRGSQAIAAVLQYARETGRLVMVAGSPGVSKTATARQFREDTPRTWYAPMDTTTSGVPMMLVELLIAMGVPEPKGPPHVLIRQICNRAAEAKGLLIVDEAQHLSDKAIEALRAVNDRVGVGVALLGNEAAYSQVGATGVKPAFAQVSSRFAQRRFIVQADERDAATLAHAWASANGEVIGQKEVAFCQQMAARPGGLRNIEMAFEGALIAARGADQDFSLQHLQGAYAQLSGQAR